MRLKDKRSYLLISEYVQRAELRRQIKIGMKRRTRRREPNRIVPRFSSIPKPQSA